MMWGVIVADERALGAGRREDRVDVVALRQTLLDPPRAPAARQWRTRVRSIHPEADVLPYVWHLVTHGPHEGLRQRGTRSLPGNAARFGELQQTEETRQAWQVMMVTVGALQAQGVVLHTPPSVAPGALGSERVRSFVAGRRSEGVSVWWEPEGLWEAAEASDLAEKAGASLIWPALVGGRMTPDLPPGCILRVDGAGPRRTLDSYQAESLVELLEEAPWRGVLFGGPAAHRNLRTIAKLASP